MWLGVEGVNGNVTFYEVIWKNRWVCNRRALFITPWHRWYNNTSSLLFFLCSSSLCLLLSISIFLLLFSPCSLSFLFDVILFPLCGSCFFPLILYFVSPHPVSLTLIHQLYLSVPSCFLFCFNLFTQCPSFFYYCATFWVFFSLLCSSSLFVAQSLLQFFSLFSLQHFSFCSTVSQEN